ncbi:pilus assembly protein TadG-related protein [Roseivivax sp. CAU 1761]
MRKPPNLSCTPHSLRGRAARRAARALGRFAADESGSLSIFGLFAALGLIAIGGVGIDLMRAEYTRNSIQNTLDQAVLAAADLEQVLDPTLVVTDYLEKMDLGTALNSVVVDRGLNYKVVTGEASVDAPSNFTRLLGLETLRSAGLATAEERIANVEISLVLDISGSMVHGSKMPQLKEAASTFVDTVLDQNVDDLVSISLVPYSEHVNAGPDITRHLSVDWKHGYSHCLEFPEAHFGSVALDTAHAFEQMQHFQWNYSGSNKLTNTVCPRYDYERIRPFSQDGTKLKQQIAKLEPRAGTSIFLGMKWAAALLDPSTRALNDALIADKTVDAAFAGRPADHGDRNTLKTIVLMTDGQHDRSNRIADWAYDSPSDVAHWAKYNLWHYLSGFANRSSWGAFHYQKYDAATGDQLLASLCDAAKAAGIVIWSIGFEVQDHGANVMRSCASSPAHFFRVEGVEIEDAFYAVARAINQLRLIQ